MKSMTKSMDTEMMNESTNRSRKKSIVISVAMVAIAGAWLLFRPELLFVNKTVNEGLPVTSAGSTKTNEAMSTVLSSGSFHSVAHDTKGTATIHQLSNGNRVVRLTGFETSNGPDVHLFLVAAKDAGDSETVKAAGYIDLGSLKGNIGDQNYNVPPEVDLTKYQAVTVWCNRFGVNFGTAPLMAGETKTSGKMAAVPMTLSTGKFHSVAHDTKGTATVLRLDDQRRVLRLTDFETSNGPDVRVYLVAANDAADSETVKSAGFMELGKLKGNIGDQNYDIPESIDLDKYKAVTIWCARFGVNFGTAPLQ
ncbi:MAG: DM13 domain-containing protein [Pirellulaceae bacterium]